MLLSLTSSRAPPGRMTASVMLAALQLFRAARGATAGAGAPCGVAAGRVASNVSSTLSLDVDDTLVAGTILPPCPAGYYCQHQSRGSLGTRGGSTGRCQLLHATDSPLGCTEPLSPAYNSSALVDDGSCTFPTANWTVVVHSEPCTPDPQCGAAGSVQALQSFCPQPPSPPPPPDACETCVTENNNNKAWCLSTSSCNPANGFMGSAGCTGQTDQVGPKGAQHFTGVCPNGYNPVAPGLSGSANLSAAACAALSTSRTCTGAIMANAFCAPSDTTNPPAENSSALTCDCAGQQLMSGQHLIDGQVFNITGSIASSAWRPTDHTIAGNAFYPGGALAISSAYAQNRGPTLTTLLS